MPERQVGRLPIQGKIFETQKGRWKARVAHDPDTPGSNSSCYSIEFRMVEKPGPARDLKLWVSKPHARVNRREYQSGIFDCLKAWLESDSADGEFTMKESDRGHDTVFCLVTSVRPTGMFVGALPHQILDAEVNPQREVEGRDDDVRADESSMQSQCDA